MSTHIGETIDDRYTVTALIGRGGMAEVYRARAEGADGFEKDVVIKRILPIHSGNSLFTTMFVDEARIASELVIFSDRCDVTEETVRARAHIVAFRALLAGERPSGEQLIGKRCEFLTQELGREFNTIGSKCRETSMSSDVVTAKVELERIREQVHNIA